jgi:hypothetical protein
VHAVNSASKFAVSFAFLTRGTNGGFISRLSSFSHSMSLKKGCDLRRVVNSVRTKKDRRKETRRNG